MMHTFFVVVGLFFLIYSVVLIGIQLFLTFRGWRLMSKEEYHAPPMLNPDVPGLSVVIGAHNEATVIRSTIRQISANRLADFELIVVDDGSVDGTGDLVIEEFGLTPAPRRRPLATLQHRPVTQAWESSDHRIVLLRKESAGTKADAVNAGIAFASMPLIAITDADTVLNMDGLSRVARRFDDPQVHGVGGSLRVLNGTQLKEEGNPRAQLPKTWLERIQAVEYMRAFVGSRSGWAEAGAMLIVSGGFGMYRRSTLLEVGGLDPSAIGEDFELTVRVQRHLAEQGQGGRVAFAPEAIAWTEVPATKKALESQRRRWHWGLMQTLWRHKSMLLRPRYGAPAMLAMPFFWVFEFAAPFIELLGLVLLPIGLITGNLVFITIFLMIVGTWLIGLAITVLNVVIDQLSSHRYTSWSETGKILLAAVVETFGYRQYLMFGRLKATFTYGGTNTWEPIPRAAREAAPELALAQ